MAIVIQVGDVRASYSLEKGWACRDRRLREDLQQILDHMDRSRYYPDFENALAEQCQELLGARVVSSNPVYEKEAQKVY